MNKIVNEYETSFYCILKNYVNTNAIGDRRGDINIHIPFSTAPITTWARVNLPSPKSEMGPICSNLVLRRAWLGRNRKTDRSSDIGREKDKQREKSRTT